MATETDVKTERLARLARDTGLGGVLIVTQRNFAWLTGGATNGIDRSREPGAGSLFVTSEGRRFVLANTIEMPRLAGEALSGLGFEPIEYPWAEDHANPAVASDLARSLLSGSASLGTDWPLPQGTNVEGAIMRLRTPLVDEEVQRYRALGADMGVSVGEACRMLRPGGTESEIADAVGAAIFRAGVRPTVILVAGDERLERYRHPVPANAVWRDAVMVVVCAERGGLIVALSRIVAAGSRAAFTDRTHATARVFARLIDATRPDTKSAHLYEVAARAYQDEGYPGEELRHHQGGAIGYRGREWVAHARSGETVTNRQAFAWNPSITGTKIEDTVLVVDGRIEMLTATPGWPAIPLEVKGETLHAADALILTAS